MNKFLHPRWHKTFLGIYQQHTYWLYKVIDDILNENKIERIVEIGTGRGALSIILGLETYQRKLERFITVDLNEPKEAMRLFKLLNIWFIQADCFDCHFPKEFNYFVPKLKSGSIVAIHDWDREVLENDIDKSLVEPIKKEDWNQNPDNLCTSFWRVK
jgi:hypothetical protein